MDYSRNGLALTEQFESCRLSAYPDSKGVPTIGYGHTAGVQLGDTCTQAQAETWLLEDVAWAASVVNSQVTVPLTQNEFDSLVDFIYNVGSGNFEGSTMLKLLNEQNYAAAAEQFIRWDKAAGVEIAGLLRRRQSEEELFELNEQ